MPVTSRAVAILFVLRHLRQKDAIIAGAQWPARDDRSAFIA
jgi:hypothetical protein